jgi:hypothetical protein
LLTSPIVAHGVGSNDADNSINCWVERLANQAFWFLTNPIFWFTVPASSYVKSFSGINGTLSLMM